MIIFEDIWKDFNRHFFISCFISMEKSNFEVLYMNKITVIFSFLSHDSIIQCNFGKNNSEKFIACHFYSEFFISYEKMSRKSAFFLF